MLESLANSVGCNQQSCYVFTLSLTLCVYVYVCVCGAHAVYDTVKLSMGHDSV